jgi:hypothetical protein
VRLLPQSLFVVQDCPVFPAAHELAIWNVSFA